jgi:hypothetical protein
MTGDTSISLRPITRALRIFAILHALFFFASLAAIPLLAPGSKIPNPFAIDGTTQAFFLSAATAIRVSDFLQLASALCLGIACALLGTASSISRLRGLPTLLIIGGGCGAAIMLALSALFSWAIVSPGAPADLGPSLHAFQFIPFLLGGPGWAGFFAIFSAGVTIGVGGVLPRWVRRFGYFLSFISAAATLVLLSIAFSPCLPISRFPGFLWLIAISGFLTRRHNQNFGPEAA